MERHVSGDAPNWAHFLFVHSIQAFGRASLECMNGKCALFHAREAASATVEARETSVIDEEGNGIVQTAGCRANAN